MRNFLLLLWLIVIPIPLGAQEYKRKIKGKVTAKGRSLKHVNVRAKDGSAGTLTNAKGAYEIETFVGNTLVFSHVGLQTIEVTVDGENNIYNLKMSPEVQELDEVVVKKKGTFTQKELLAEYPTNNDLIKTAWGIVDKDRASYSMRVVDGSEILPSGIDFLSSLRRHFPNMIVNREFLMPKVYLQNWTDSAAPTAIFDVDGFIYEQPPTWLAPDEIDRIAVMKRNGAIVRYGPQAAGGVIIINTKEKTRVDEFGAERIYDNMDLMDSLVGRATEKKRFMAPVPDYVKAYERVKSEAGAQQLFDKQKRRFEDRYPYFLDMSDYFRNKWGNEEMSGKILEDMVTRFSSNAIALKALAYHLEELGQYEKALKTYLKVLKIRSRDAQSYRDVANGYNRVSRFKRALSYYARFETAIKVLDTLPYDKYGADFLMTIESDNILRLQGDKMALQDDLLQESGPIDQNVRMLFEWNHPGADFKLRVVSPDDYYDEWLPPLAKSVERSRGYYSKQFFLDDDFGGEWQINLDYYGNQTDLPTYFKATVFFDYGRPTQKKQTRLFKLHENDIGLKLLSVDTEGKFMKP